MNGKSVEIDNTDAEGRLILSGETPPFWCLLLISSRHRCAILYVYDLQATYAHRRGHAYWVCEVVPAVNPLHSLSRPVPSVSLLARIFLEFSLYITLLRLVLLREV
jgi:hypothetical protein